jgi:hypothetical protein
MSDNDSSNDLDLEPVRTGPSAKTLVTVAVGVLAIAGAYMLNNRNAEQRKTEQLQRAADAWADLSRCLVPRETELGQVARTARRIELGQPTSIARLPAAERRSHWPYRCATFASVMTRALFDSKSDDRGHRILAMIVSQAATELESGQLHTGREDRRKYLDELWAAVSQAQLPPGRSTGSIAAPPAQAQPASAPLLDAVLAGPDNAKALAQDALQSSTLRVLFGLSERRVCTFANDGGAQGLSQFDCRRTRPADFVRPPWLGSAEDGQPALYSGRANGNDPSTHGYLEPQLSIGEAIVGGHVSQQSVTLLSFNDQRPELTVTVRGRTASGALDDARQSQLVSTHTISNRRGGGWVIGDVVIALGERPALSSATSADAGASPDASAVANDAGARADATSNAGSRVGVLYAGALSIDGATARASWSVPFAERGTASSAWLSEPRVEGCRLANGDSAIVAYTSDGHALVLWKTARGFIAPIVAEARPGSIHCDGDYVRLGWFEPVPVPSAHVSTCGQTGCAHARAPSPDIDTDPVIAPVANRVLAAYTLRTENGGNGGLRYRLAPLTELATAPEHVVFDDGEHEGLQVEPTLSVFVRGRRAVIFVTSKGVAGETYGFRINEDGSFTPIRRASRAGRSS